MNYKIRSNAVRAEARNKLIELRNERLAKKALLAPPTPTYLPASAAEPVVVSEFVGSPELVNALKGVVAEPQIKSPEPVAKSPKKAAKPSTPKKAKVVQKKVAEPAVSAEAPSKSTVPVELPVEAPVAPVMHTVPAVETFVEPIQLAQPEQTPAPAVFSELEPMPAPVDEAAKPLTPTLASFEPRPTVGSKLSLGPVSDDVGPFSLERLPMIGPGLVWHLQKAGVHSLDDLAFEDVDGLIQRLGAISELMRLTDWIRLAKDQDKKAS